MSGEIFEISWVEEHHPIPIEEPKCEDGFIADLGKVKIRVKKYFHDGLVLLRRDG